MFRRTDKATPATDHPAKEGGKGHATPTRKEAEAAAKARAKAAGNTKAARQHDRDKRAAQSRRIREGLKSGDERFLPERDKGPVKRFVRNWVDARLSIAEILLPILLILMFLIYSGNKGMVEFGNKLWSTTILITIIDTLWLNFRLKRALRTEFPDDSHRGTTTYALLRVLQPRFMRLPKPQVTIGGRPKKPKKK